MIRFFKILLKSGAADVIGYDCLTHNVYVKQFESSAEHKKDQDVILASFSFCKVEYQPTYS